MIERPDGAEHLLGRAKWAPHRPQAPWAGEIAAWQMREPARLVVTGFGSASRIDSVPGPIRVRVRVLDRETRRVEATGDGLPTLVIRSALALLAARLALGPLPQAHEFHLPGRDGYHHLDTFSVDRNDKVDVWGPDPVLIADNWHAVGSPHGTTPGLVTGNGGPIPDTELLLDYARALSEALAGRVPLDLPPGPAPTTDDLLRAVESADAALRWGES